MEWDSIMGEYRPASQHICSGQLDLSPEKLQQENPTVLMLSIMLSTFVLGSRQIELPDCGTFNGDDHIQTWGAVSDKSVAFTIHIKSHGSISPGLAVCALTIGG
jgi:hypothetical protein